MVGLQWLVSLYNNRLNGILADEMGLGKTLQVSWPGNEASTCERLVVCAHSPDAVTVVTLHHINRLNDAWADEMGLGKTLQLCCQAW